MSHVLTKEALLTKCKVEDLDQIKCVSMWGNELNDVSVINSCKNVTLVTLSVNNINTLKHFKDCSKLAELYLRRNNISSLDEIIYLKYCKNLRVLWLEENPIQKMNNYRAFIIKALPQIIKLDNVVITEEEREKVNSFKNSFNKLRKSSITLSSVLNEDFISNILPVEINSTDSEFRTTANSTQKSINNKVLKRTSNKNIDISMLDCKTPVVLLNREFNDLNTINAKCALNSKTGVSFAKSPVQFQRIPKVNNTLCSNNLNNNVINQHFASGSKFYKSKIKSPVKKNFKSCEKDKDFKNFSIDTNKNNGVIFAIENLLGTLSHSELKHVQNLINGKLPN